MDGKEAGTIIRRLIDGENVESIDVDQCGVYEPYISALIAAFEENGTPGVIECYNTISRADPALLALVASDTPEEQQKPMTPPLPKTAQAVYAHAAPCAAWLDNYVAYASEAAPMTPKNFHEAAGLFAVSTAIARRLALNVSAGTIYPNLYILYLAPSTIYRKSTGFALVENLLRSAGLGYLLMPQKVTPEAFVVDLSPTKMPPKQCADMESFLKRRAFASKRGFFRDEVSALFAGMRRDFNAGLLELILGLYDCPSHYEESTISRGDVVINDASLTFFGASTPAEMNPYLSESTHWLNGLWARFAIVSPDEVPDFSFYPPDVSGGTDLALELKSMFAMFPTPVAVLVTGDDLEEGEEPHIAVSAPVPPSGVVLADGVWAAWEAYAHALHDLLLVRDLVDEDFHASYGRLGTMVMKVAMVLAVMDATHLPVTVSIAHYARAQSIVERWRENLHRMRLVTVQTTENRLQIRIRNALAKRVNGATVRDLCNALSALSKEVSESLLIMEKAGIVTHESMVTASRRSIELWRLV